ncbi:hypothetical protein DRO26_02390 [Candidatus Bathyarchaeota archaeon]|nr:MAG: hypothetical protein DRO26_02390 [Candidatus Bathyarchaeota archaeon]
MKRFEKNSPSFSVQEKHEKLGLLLKELVERSSEGAVILVEGVKDAKALKSIGVSGKICCIKNRKIPLYDLLSEYVNVKEELIVLTDFDRRGVQLAEKITRYLEKYGKHPNLTFWNRIYGFLSGEIKDVEGLSSYLKHVKRRYRKHPLSVMLS